MTSTPINLCVLSSIVAVALALACQGQNTNVKSSDRGIRAILRDFEDHGKVIYREGKTPDPAAGDEIANDVREILLTYQGFHHDFRDFVHFKQLRTLKLWGPPETDYAPLGKLTELRTLELVGGGKIKLDVVADLPKLEYLYIRSTELHDWEPVGRAMSLRRLFLADTNIDSLEPVGNLKNLEDLNVRKFAPAGDVPATRMDVEPLGRLDSLKSLTLLGIPIVDFAPLARCKSLRKLTITRFRLENEKSQIRALVVARPDIDVRVLEREPSPES